MVKGLNDVEHTTLSNIRLMVLKVGLMGSAGCLESSATVTQGPLVLQCWLSHCNTTHDIRHRVCGGGGHQNMNSQRGVLKEMHSQEGILKNKGVCPFFISLTFDHHNNLPEIPLSLCNNYYLYVT